MEMVPIVFALEVVCKSKGFLNFFAWYRHLWEKAFAVCDPVSG